MCLVSDDRIVAVDYENRSMKLIDVTTGRVLLQLELQYGPLGVCRMSSDMVAVTLPEADRIQVAFLTYIKQISTLSRV